MHHEKIYMDSKENIEEYRKMKIKKEESFCYLVRTICLNLSKPLDFFPELVNLFFYIHRYNILLLGPKKKGKYLSLCV